METTSLLAASIAGCARLHEKLDASEAAQAAERCLKRIVRAIETFEGRVLQNGGDEIIAEFDTAADALYAAVEMQQNVADLSPVSGVKLAIRVGVSHGEDPGREVLTREAARLVGMAKPGQSLAAGRITRALPETLRTRTTDTALALPGEEPVVEIAADTAPASSLAETGPADAWLYVRYNGNLITLDERHPAINMGRESACELVIRDGRASRRHATIKRRGDLIVLIDKSRNGTYVTMDGTEQFIREGECTLHGRGLIAFAASASGPEADCAEFECGKCG